MGSTNKTAHYNLPQFIGTDKPGWLTDVNDAFQKTDEGIYQAAVAAQGAQTSADAATSAVQTVNADLHDTKTTLTATTTTAQSALTNTQQQAGQIAQNSTNVSTINARLGNTDISSIGGGTVTGAIKAISEQAGAAIDDTVTATSEHAVKSSGIASYVQGISAGLTFGQDTSGNWGYKIGGADPVIPFKRGVTGATTISEGVATSFNTPSTTKEGDVVALAYANTVTMPSFPTSANYEILYLENFNSEIDMSLVLIKMNVSGQTSISLGANVFHVAAIVS